MSEALNLNTKVRFGAVRYLLSSAFVLYCLMRWVWSLRALVAVLCLLLQGPRNTLFHLCSPSLTGALAWNADQLSSGSRDRMILQRDIRTPPLQSERRLQGHRQEVCGLKWSTDHQLLASGGNDNKVQCSVLLTRGSASLHPHQDLSHPPLPLSCSVELSIAGLCPTVHHSKLLLSPLSLSLIKLRGKFNFAPVFG